MSKQGKDTQEEDPFKAELDEESKQGNTTLVDNDDDASMTRTDGQADSASEAVTSNADSIKGLNQESNEATDSAAADMSALENKEN